MRLRAGVEWGAHCLLALAALPEGTTAPAARLAGLHALPPAYLAKQLQALRRAGLVTGGEGRGGGYALARPPTQVTLLDVVAVIEGVEPLFQCTEIRQRGPYAPASSTFTARCGIAAAFDRAEQAWRAELAATSLADLALPMTVPASQPAVHWLIGADQ